MRDLRPPAPSAPWGTRSLRRHDQVWIPARVAGPADPESGQLPLVFTGRSGSIQAAVHVEFLRPVPLNGTRRCLRRLRAALRQFRRAWQAEAQKE